jgi:hypothetical protein
LEAFDEIVACCFNGDDEAIYRELWRPFLPQLQSRRGTTSDQPIA